jgi:hypothetical protein
MPGFETPVINGKKSVVTRFGSRFNKPCAKLVFNHGGSIKWFPYCCYLSIQFISGSTFRCQHDDAKSRFFVHLMQFIARLVASLLKTSS